MAGPILAVLARWTVVELLFSLRLGYAVQPSG